MEITQMEDKLIRIFKSQVSQKNTFPDRSDKEVSPDGDKKSILSKLSEISKTAWVLTLAAAITCTATGCTVRSFHRAAVTGDIKKVEALLQEGTDPNAMYNYLTVLSRASRNGHVNIVKKLLDNGADVNAKNWGKSTALMNASRGGHVDVVKLLLDNGADVNAKSGSGWTALMNASHNDQSVTNAPIIVTMLLDNGADVNDTMEYGISINMYNDDITFKVIKDSPSALTWATAKNNFDVIKILLDRGGDVNIKGFIIEGEIMLLFKAAYNGRADVVKILLEKGVDVNTGLESKFVSRMEKRTEKYAKANNAEKRWKIAGMTALMAASKGGHVDVVKMLLSKGADVNAITENGWTALDFTKEKSHQSIIRMLLETDKNKW